MTTRTAYDVVVIGAGIVGSAIARELSGHQLSVALIDARSDVGDGTSKANTAILHTGFDAKPGTLESAMVHRGYHLLSDYATHTGIPVERTGAILVAWDQEQLDALPHLLTKAEDNGYHSCEIIDAAAVYADIPNLGPGALGGLTVPDESIICTWTVNLALATDAVNRGTVLLTGHRVDAVDIGTETTMLATSGGEVTARWIVNAAGLGADLIDALFGHQRFTVTPRRGELIVYDKLARALVDKIVLPVPTARGKGVLVSPTIYGNVMLGPTSEDLQDRTATGTSETGFEFLLGKGKALMPRLLDEEVTATYSGLRAAIDHGDYLIEADPAQRYLLVGGIRSTGLTAGMAVAEYVRDELADAGLSLTPKPELPAPPQMPNLGEAFPRPFQQSDVIDADPAYGRIVCFCERVTEGEIRDACHSVIPPTTMDGLRRRTRVMNGRCQAFFCGAEVQSLFDRETRQETRR
ncbi:NAD(P)/FAD-dependent oxidoreductase [Mycolicibacterium rhodesiae]|uniref:FAD/NAD(P)-binding oxidoreductase n=1 Tax=Mycolicibacterium rhodesiae TaxID=36814 RepID=A0A1X0J620_MYCRH|nr:NAD(P)/FAD-dependent oxidoreductase [Mycolicibacterium rhodesiae]MCV7345835.1 NAD(P)/FAD-dependent oxidoreductase [Mycolicibacterium rhodesiae]ORB57196.1 FAD/NAD(P)-binding oxidoreductase [Mycolicibacterium rhodesiae]